MKYFIERVTHTHNNMLLYILRISNNFTINSSVVCATKKYRKSALTFIHTRSTRYLSNSNLKHVDTFFFSISTHNDNCQIVHCISIGTQSSC